MDRTHLNDMLTTIAKANGMSMTELARQAADFAQLDDDVPTVADHYATVEATDGLKAGWEKRKGLYQALVDAFGDRRLDQVSASDIEALAEQRRQAVVDREDARQAKLADRGLAGAPRRTGKGAKRNIIEAARRYWQIAVDNRLIVDNPARKVRLPKRPTPRARALKPEQVEELWDAVISGGDDPELDGLIVWCHLELAARRGGLLTMKIRDLKPDQCGIVLYEKGDVETFQPCSRELIQALLTHATERGPGRPNDPVLYYKDSAPESPHPLGKKRWETLYARIRRELPWAREVWTRGHDLRHTAITMMERISGSPAVARLFARHSDRTTTDGYDRADQDELRAALTEYIGRPVGEDAKPGT